MKKYVALAILVLMVTSSLDAAPRGRRRARWRGRTTPTVRTSQETYRTQQIYRLSETVQPESQVVASPTSGEVEDKQPTVTEVTGNVIPASARRATVTPDRVQPSSVAAAEVDSVNAALAELNALRARRGLRPFIEDPSLTAIALRKASIQANRGSVGQPGGTMGGARFEGVGMGAQFITCYQYATNATYAGAASVHSHNGRRYHCLLLR